MILHIKNMVCDRCIMVVRQQFISLGLTAETVVLGQATIHPDADTEQLNQISAALKVLGFELIDSEKDRLIERIKNLVIEKVHYSDLTDTHINFSNYLSDKLNKEYTYLSRAFSDAEDITIEKFIIQQKIEKVKELMSYGELNLTEVAFKMGYSSSAHLSAQFKQTTGMTPSQFKASAPADRKSINNI
ncbi:helix-turn-helix transcriptional regulator [Mucilaginibacter sp. SMC90]|uniref:helix-turn-helix domain-containing protein n=2 Tax=Mucilaginibacter TaxID=423349 RepID=UPI001BD08BA1|nr:MULTISPECIES: helix-turn-helix transcriptional regulator [unclassified Mucilaginibacter]MBS7565677.1 helix-turn-helix transcriptional regulator [Mucilaginibacter sp. Bleaf8]UOE49861.1 helix-turn-helix transcriptional regulator [Mucilaginibacter sp. SMC90]